MIISSSMQPIVGLRVIHSQGEIIMCLGEGGRGEGGGGGGGVSLR